MMDDLISRQAVLDWIAASINKYGGRYTYDQLNMWGLFTQMVTEFPSAQQWHEIRKTPMTEDERTEWSERLGYDIEYEDAFLYSNLPDDGQEVIVCTSWGCVYVDKYADDSDGGYFEGNGEIDDIVAWMEIPKPYKESER